MNIVLITVATVAAISIIALVVTYLKYKNANEYAQKADDRVQDLEAMVAVLQHEVAHKITYDIKPIKKKKPFKQKTSKEVSVSPKKRGRKPKF